MKITALGKLLLMTGIACVPLMGKGALQGDFDPKTITPSMELVTPHVKWLTPSAQGPLKVLFVMSQGQMREVVELAQRMDLDYRMVVVGKFNLPPLKPEDLRRDFQEQVNAAIDLIVVCVPDWKQFSYMQRYQILKKVKEGTPLLTFAAGADEYLGKAIENKVREARPWLSPWKGLPAFATNYTGTAEFQAGTMDQAVFGKGSIYLLKGYKTAVGQALTPMRQFADPLDLNPAEYDYYLGMIIHIMRAAARKTAPVELKGNDYLCMNRENPAPVEFAIAARDGLNADLHFALRTRKGVILADRRQSVKLKAGDNKVSFETGKIPAGGYFADLWVEQAGKILEFGSLYLEVSGSNTLAGVEVRPSILCGAGAAGKALLNVNPPAEGLTLNISQRDTFGRVTARMTLPVTREMAEKKEAAFTLPATTPLTIVQYLDVELCRADEVLDRKSKGFSICDLPAADDIRFVIWGGMNDNSYLSYYLFKNFYDSGFDTQYTTLYLSSVMANLRHIPYATHLGDKGKAERANKTGAAAHLRSPCLTDPEYLKSEAKKLTTIAERLQPFSTTDFSVGDECDFTHDSSELCFSPTCTAAFHEFLKKEYGTVENLNREYGTEFKTFAEIKPLTLDDARQNPKLMPLWVDFRLCMESTWAGMLAFCRDTIRKTVPNARVGYEGSDYDVINSTRAFDWQKTLSVIQLDNTYDGAFVPYAVLDLSRPGALLGSGWYGGYEEYRKYNDWDSRAFNRYVSWRHLFRGANSFWVWYATEQNYGHGHGSVMAPDFSFLECFAPNLEEMREIKGGEGKLLMKAKRANDRTAILYSASSVHAASLSGSGGTMQGVLVSLVPLMEDTLHQFRIVSYRQLAEGILEKDGYRFLILPYAQALSGKEIENIRAFVKNGGTVIADIRPGVCNEHGKAYDKGALDDVFGVIQNPCVTQKLAGVIMAFNAAALPTNLNAAADATLKLQSGQAQAKAGDAPALIVNSYGRGKAILMNFTLHDYKSYAPELSIEVEKISKQAPEMRAVFEQVLGLAGIGPKLKLAPAVPGLRAYRYQAGALGYVGFLQHPCRARAAQFGEYENYKTFNRTQIPVPVKTTATLEGKSYVYDIRRCKSLGYTNAIAMDLGPGRAEFYSLLPYEVKGIEIKAPGRIRQGDTLEWSAQLKINEGKPGLHVFRVALVSPQGREVGCYTANVSAEQGQASGKIAMALNDEPGRWTMRIKDIASGQTADTAFKLNRAKWSFRI